MTNPAQIESVFSDVADRVAGAGVFGNVSVRGGRLICEAKGSAAPAAYRLEVDGGRIWVSLVTADRWLSESIEADLMHTGDDLGELLEEELVDQGVSAPRPMFEHFRSDDLLFTFRTPVDVEPSAADAAATLARWLLAYEACFRRLGDMDESGEE